MPSVDPVVLMLLFAVIVAVFAVGYALGYVWCVRIYRQILRQQKKRLTAELNQQRCAWRSLNHENHQ